MGPGAETRQDKGDPISGTLQPGDPQRLGPYTLLGRLGEGGMGTVYRARAEDGRLVAVKVIRAIHAGDERFRARFRREVEAARRVARFCTAPVLDADIDAEHPYVVTEFIDGPDLQRAVEGEGPLATSSLEGLAVGVATALAAIHAAGVVHRDLKPGNVMLSRSGPRVIDFGIAGALDFTQGLTENRQMLGTPSFMAPEQLEGDSPITGAADIFAWGCVVAFAGTGRGPFGATNPVRQALRVLYEDPDLDGLDPGLRSVVELALQKHPARRPTAQALLSSLLGGPQPVDPVATDELLRRTWPHVPPPPPPRRLRGRLVGTALVTLLIMALIGATAAAMTALEGRGSASEAAGAAPSQAPTSARSPAPEPTPRPTTAPTPSPAPSPSSGPNLTDANQPGPSGGPPLDAALAPSVLIEDWQRAGADAGCAPLAFTGLNHVDEATPRRYNATPDDWGLTYDKPGLPGSQTSGEYCADCGRGVFGVGSASPARPTINGVTPAPTPPTALPAGEWVQAAEGRRWDDGSVALHALNNTGFSPKASVRLFVPGQDCLYTAWSYLGRDHLNALLDSLRVVTAPT